MCGREAYDVECRTQTHAAPRCDRHLDFARKTSRINFLPEDPNPEKTKRRVDHLARANPLGLS